MPHWDYETTLWNDGVLHVCGIDEVGRGCFAGPIFVGCVGFASGVEVPDTVALNDSKKVTQRNREMAKDWAESNAVFVGVGSGSVEEINSIGIMGALYKAAMRAVKNAEKTAGESIHHFLVDAITIPEIDNKRQTPIVRGDSLSFSIAAASIVAKVERDAYMQKLAESDKYNGYGWNTNKGYGTREHREAILKHGITDQHRKQFVNTFLTNVNANTANN